MRKQCTENDHHWYWWDKVDKTTEPEAKRKCVCGKWTWIERKKHKEKG